jgi:hypothetical protein
MSAGNCLPIDMVLCPRRLESSPAMLWERQVLRMCHKVLPELIFH